MARISAECKIPKRIGDCVVYLLDGNMVLRKISGFSSGGMLKDSKYEKSRQNANEFGKVSALCKKIRVVLKDILPKNNNLAVCNSFVKIMRQAMVSDTISVLGQRNLAMAFKNNAGGFLKGYNFNPDALLADVMKIDFCLEKEGGRLLFDSFVTNEVFVFPDTTNTAGLRLHYLFFDFMTEKNQLISSEWNLIGKDTIIDGLILQAPIKNMLPGVLFTILEIQFYIFDDGTYIPLDDRSKVIFIIDACSTTLKT